MRKLEKKSLGELARTMPVISKANQATYIGGTIFFDESGAYIKK